MSILPPFARLNEDHLPQSALAQELRDGVARLRFEPGLEAQYRTSHLRRLRLRVRLWFSLGVALSLVYVIVQALRTGLGSVDFDVVLLVIFPCALALAWLDVQVRTAVLAALEGVGAAQRSAGGVLGRAADWRRPR